MDTSPGVRMSWRAWLIGWVGAAVLGVANGVVRAALYQKRIGPRQAHHLSTATLVLLVVLPATLHGERRRWLSHGTCGRHAPVSREMEAGVHAWLTPSSSSVLNTRIYVVIKLPTSVRLESVAGPAICVTRQIPLAGAGLITAS